ncbi:hypothetical protein HQ346_12405 [Rhodococcus sp. BP-252]|uniref:hypothetical protein n=1 Tax=unclassified Rhodococcus (in: high G+C Gram-positive bacteria) TaxID=192944 RepID=UPI001C9ABF20|nr:MULTISPECIES: hypothetical protein [unclassified Rhodococcus (in: high G+C Gram-positive bacteria)]MBY6412476.1 hypothetical protein [Rhodococcus sp. BP-320]MBY6417056.1 hypothetical protein [Rhodococcus sp. BP-321]MBY6421981.1 hypothetical protein [Rhodococcus sp. BP-324]MBY6427080.1 hypothetical protein [Rhodococcus sp. BP-323]MBY6432409.1 hypothetical protein [Rhodococcus sp. BP-322]
MHARVRSASRGSIGSLVATYVALGYARLWRGKIAFDDDHRLFVASGMRGGFGRGGTTIGGVYLTRTNTSRAVLRHESVHADQWARYGVLFAVRYLVEEVRHPGASNKYEIEAGLGDGGYKGKPPRF